MSCIKENEGASCVSAAASCSSLPGRASGNFLFLQLQLGTLELAILITRVNSQRKRLDNTTCLSISILWTNLILPWTHNLYGTWWHGTCKWIPFVMAHDILIFCVIMGQVTWPSRNYVSIFNPRSQFLPLKVDPDMQLVFARFGLFLRAFPITIINSLVKLSPRPFRPLLCLSFGNFPSRFHLVPPSGFLEISMLSHLCWRHVLFIINLFWCLMPPLSSAAAGNVDKHR